LHDHLFLDEEEKKEKQESSACPLIVAYRVQEEERAALECNESKIKEEENVGSFKSTLQKFTLLGGLDTTSDLL